MCLTEDGTKMDFLTMRRSLEELKVGYAGRNFLGISTYLERVLGCLQGFPIPV
jgi:hypothetical protein